MLNSFLSAAQKQFVSKYDFEERMEKLEANFKNQLHGIKEDMFGLGEEVEELEN